MMDRRQSPRIVDKNAVVVTIGESPAAPELSGRTFFCKTGNISEGGIMLHVESVVPQGAQLTLRVALHKPIRAFDLTGKVAWTAPTGPDNLTPIGIQFLSGKGRDLESWQQVVNQKLLFCGPDDLDIQPSEPEAPVSG